MSSPAVIRNAAVESWEDHVEAWHALGRQAGEAVWARAAIALSVRTQSHEAGLERFAKEVGFGKSTMYAYARTFGFFPDASIRIEALSFYAHLVTASLSKTAEEARAMLSLAVSGDWSTREIRAHLNPTALPEPVACDAEAGACGPPTVDDKIFHISAMVDSFYSVREYEIGPLVRVGSKKSLKELSRKIKDAVKWLAALEEAIKERTK